MGSHNYVGATEVWCSQFYLQPDISAHNPVLTPAGEGWYSIYLPGRRDGRVS